MSTLQDNSEYTVVMRLSHNEEDGDLVSPPSVAS